MSEGWLCSPASMISIMNGVHCQTSTVTTTPAGGPDERHRVNPKNSSTLFSSPNSDENICCFQISAATTGISRNGVISSVRTRPWPRNLRSSRIANGSAEEEREQDREDGHLDARVDRVAEERVAQQRPVVLEPDELRRLGNQRLRLVLEIGEAVIDAHQERQLRDQDQEDQGRKQRQPPTPRGGERVSDLPLAGGVDGLSRLTTDLLDRLRGDLLALARARCRALRRAGDHAREELGALGADVLELRYADVLHRRAGPVAWSCRGC